MEFAQSQVAAGLTALKGDPFDWEIPPGNFLSVRSFTCNGEIHPEDRVNSVSAKWHLRALIYDAVYTPREVMYHRDGKLILGKHAKHSRVCHDGKCKIYKKKTVVKVPEGATAISESEVMRFNAYNL